MRHTRIHRDPRGQLYSAIPSASGSLRMRLVLLLVGLAAAAEVRPGAHSPQPSHLPRAPRATPSSRRRRATTTPRAGHPRQEGGRTGRQEAVQGPPRPAQKGQRRAEGRQKRRIDQAHARRRRAADPEAAVGRTAVGGGGAAPRAAAHAAHVAEAQGQEAPQEQGLQEGHVVTSPSLCDGMLGRCGGRAARAILGSGRRGPFLPPCSSLLFSRASYSLSPTARSARETSQNPVVNS